MKTNINVLKPIVIFIVSLVMFSCTKDDIENRNLTEAKQGAEAITNEGKASDSPKVTIKCQSTCDNSLADCIMEGQDLVVSCSCSGCIMEITIRDKQGNITVNEVKDLSYEVNYLKFFKEFMDERYAGVAYEITEVSVETDATMISELYSYSLADGTNETILFAGKADGSTTTRIDCTGSCGCREQYDLGTNTASCSCSDCVMNVTIVENRN